MEVIRESKGVSEVMEVVEVISRVAGVVGVADVSTKLAHGNCRVLGICWRGGLFLSSLFLTLILMKVKVKTLKQEDLGEGKWERGCSGRSTLKRTLKLTKERFPRKWSKGLFSIFYFCPRSKTQVEHMIKGYHDLLYQLMAIIKDMIGTLDFETQKTTRHCESEK